MNDVAQEEPEPELDLGDPALNDAAVKIQAVQRGNAGRKDFDDKKTEEAIAAEKAALLTEEDIARRAADAAAAAQKAATSALSVATEAEAEAKQEYRIGFASPRSRRRRLLPIVATMRPPLRSLSPSPVGKSCAEENR